MFLTSIQNQLYSSYYLKLFNNFIVVSMLLCFTKAKAQCYFSKIVNKNFNQILHQNRVAVKPGILKKPKV